ncbi:MAG TPA: tRNA (adenosine(37)-N6)-threonylcarbamoyltransferase complex ATPase subunit type 1 TsaE [Candidatus Binatia bacterium]|jgi:tRNA threonylcarbamoyladenosine biosynthesis protein TsaE
MKPQGSSRLARNRRSPAVISRSAAQTRAWGKKLGRLLQGGDIIGLTGDLGSGKTCFVRGVAEGAEVGKEAWIRSPTFTLINEYDGRLPVYHVDLYRIGAARELEELNLREYLYGDGVSLIEWFEKMPPGEVDEWLGIHFEHGSQNQRAMTFEPHGPRYEALLKELTN